MKLSENVNAWFRSNYKGDCEYEYIVEAIEALESENAKLRKALEVVEEFIREVSLSVYENSDPLSLLESLRCRATKLLEGASEK